MKLAGHKFFIVFILIFLAELCKAQLPALIPYRKGDLWGYCDSNKVVKIEPKYTNVGWFDKFGIATVEYKDTASYETRAKYGDSDFYTKKINTNGIEIPGNFNGFDIEFCYNSYSKIINTKTGATYAEGKFINVKNYVGNRCLLLAQHDTIWVFLKNEKPFYFIDKQLKSIVKILDDNTLVYSKRGKDSTIKILSRFNQKISFLCEDKKGRKYLRYQNGKFKYLKDTSIAYAVINEGSYLFENQGAVTAYSKTGKKLFTLKTINGIKAFGKSLFIESYKDNNVPRFNIINVKGVYIAKGLTDEQKGEAVSDCEKFSTVYYKNVDSCYVIQDTNEVFFTICDKGKLTWLGEHFIL